MIAVKVKRRALTAVLLLASVAVTGLANAEMGNPASTPCDGFMDCIYTAYWWAFLR